MALICVNGCRECTGCMACFDREIREEFHREVRQRESVAAAAAARKSHYRARPGCDLPSDRMSPEELAALNGPVVVWKRYRDGSEE